MSHSEDRAQKAEAARLARTARVAMVGELVDKGQSNQQIADILGISENEVRQIRQRDLTETVEASVTVQNQTEIIWFPDVYGGRTEAPWTTKVADISLVDLTELVKQRAKEDGEFAIENGLVGDNEDKMRRMMAFVSRETNIQQCVAHILKEGAEQERTVDWVCRDLADASKVMVR